MPICHLSQEFLRNILHTPPNKSIQYVDKELIGFILEYRPSGVGTWYFRYRNKVNKISYFRMGTTNDMNALHAREQAYHVYRLIANGDDPKDQKKTQEEITIKEFAIEQYLPQAKLKKRSWNLDKRALEQYFFPFFANRALKSIKKIDIISWHNNLAKRNLKKSTCNRILSVVKTLFNSAQKWEMLKSEENPCKNIAPFHEITPQVRYLDISEASQLMEELKKTPENKSALALQLLLYTGARKTEILTARWEYVNIEARILTVPLSKSGKARYIPLSDDAITLITCLPKNHKSPWLFPSSDPNKHISSLYLTWNKVRKKLKLDGMRVHDLRHSFASLLVNNGCSLYEVQKILGHHAPKVTMRYAHLAQASLIEAANKVGNKIHNRK